MAPIVTMVGPKTPHGKESSVEDVMQNIKVFVRCRPLKSSEKKNVIEMCVDRKEVRCNESKNSNERYNSKTFTFDNVFTTDTTQLQVYQSVVEPLIEQVVMGYNCTVFAYGQTGTGKTYTMEGERSVNDDLCSWEEDPIAGIIPRALHQLFETLHSEESEHTVRVSFLELYNEELYDLLSAIDDTTKLKIFEDASRKGSIIVSGLEEITVHSKAEIYEILRKGSSKRQTAATLLNACSSRSHTIFSVTVHIKENAIDGEDLVKIGKLNLVDLAGSENIGRSGAIDKRAREAGNINQSLLTLGRVITSLVDRTPHIPYRESKLTRLLQESLGGRTKTSIIATISPNIADADDTLSTLEYAQRAKKITNKPEINQKMSKKTLLREYTAEIERLRRDLAASREKNGIYINEENYHQMEQQIKDQTQEIEEKLAEINALTEEMNKIQLLFDSTKEELDSKLAELDVTNKNLKKTSKKLTETEHNLMETQTDRNEQKHLVVEHLKTEELLSTQAKKLLNVAEVTTTHVGKLHQKVDRQKNVETTNWQKTNEFQQKFANDMNRLEELVSITTTSYNDSLDEMQSAITEKISCVEAVVSGAQNKVLSFSQSMNEQKNRLSSLFTKDRIVLEQSITLKDSNTKLVTTFGQSFDNIMAKVEESQNAINAEIEKINEIVGQQRQELEAMVMKQNSHLKKMSKITVKSFNNIKSDFKTLIDTQNEEMASIMSQMESSTKANSESQQAIDQELDEFERVMKSQMEKLNDIKVKRIKARVETENASSDVNNKLKSTANTRTNGLNEINAKVDGFVSEWECEGNVGLKYIESVDNMNTENTQQMLNKTNGLIVTNTELPNLTKQLISDRKEELTKQMTYSGQLIDDSIKMCDKQLIAKQTALKAVEDTLNQGFEDQKKSIEDIAGNMELISECVSDKTSEMVRMSQTLEKSQIREIEDRYKSFEVFVRNDLIKDIPTGTTPQKTEYCYPRDLVQTSPHERILQRFRLQTDANNAINTSLPEEYESEFLSDSSSSVKSFSSNDENIKPMTDTQKRRKVGLNSKVKSNSSLKSISESNQLLVTEKGSSKRTATSKPLTANQIN